MKHFKIDYFSGIWTGLSLHDVADMYKLRGVLFSDYFENGFYTTIGGEGWFTYINNGIKIFVPSADLASIPAEVRNQPIFYDLSLPRIKIDFSGNGLEYYRSLLGDGKCVEDILRTPYADFHPTRVDLALDYVDEHGDTFQDLKKYLTELALDGKQRVCCAGLQGGIKYDLKLGDQSTIYLGGTSGDRLLRIYDKKMEYSLPDGHWKVPVDALPYGDCKTWIRYEFQCRRDAAASVLYHPLIGIDRKPIYDRSGIVQAAEEDTYTWAYSNIKTLMERYAFRDMNLSIQHKDAVILPFWSELLSEFDENLPIIQISHFVQFDSLIERAERNVMKNRNSIKAYIAIHGIDGLIQMLDNDLIQSQKDRDSLDPDLAFTSSFRHNAFLLTLLSYSPNVEDFIGLTRVDGYWRIKR